MFNKEIYILNRNDSEGGAAKAASRLIHSLKKKKLNVKYIVDLKSSNLEYVISHKSLVQKFFILVKPHLDQLPIRLFYKKKNSDTWGLGWFPFFFKFNKQISSPNKIIHLHWISFGFIPLLSLLKIKKHFFWTMHDMWAMTGGCHYTGNCSKFETGCNKCPQLNSKHYYDLSFFSFKLKSAILKRCDFTIICCSNWLADEFRKSTILNDKKIVVIPNTIDSSLYSPRSIFESRRALGLPIDKNIILISALASAEDSRKGFKFLIEALKIIKNQNIEIFNSLKLIVLGSSSSELFIEGLDIQFFGKINDEILMPIIYSASDLSVAPSIQENLSNSVMESLSCGTPVAAFNIGGMPDMIIPGFTGELADSISSQRLANSILTILNNKKVFYSDNCRNFVLKYFSEDLISEKHISLYKSAGTP